jgi:ADP-heptose:LPS heptosyltransferase
LRALLVRLSSIGDVVHTLPALAALSRGGWRCGWLVEPAARPLLDGNPFLEQLHLAPPARGFSWRGAGHALRDIRREPYDVALDLQGLWKSAAWARFSGAPRVVGFEAAFRREPASRLLLRETAAQPETATHVIDKNLALLRPLGIEAHGAREFPLPSLAVADEVVATRLAERGIGDFVILNPGGGWTSKLWPAEGYGAVARSLYERGLRSIVTWGPGEEALAAQVEASSSQVATRSFPTSLLEYAALARRARVVVAADTGPLHLACAVGAPVVALFGPTDPARNGPFSPADRVVRRLPPCAPCHKRACPVHDGVMAAIPADEVAAAVLARFAAEEALHARPV